MGRWSMFLAFGLLGLGVAATAQDAPLPWTAEQDHQDMMDRLGVTTVRPGPSGDEHAPNHANYDEALANPYPVWPELMRANDGTRVTTAEQWWKKRRPEIVEAFERDVYGRVPADVPRVTWRVVAEDHEFIGFRPVTVRHLVGEVDNSAFPSISVRIRMMVALPDQAKGKVPVLVMFGPARYPSPSQPSAADAASMDAALKAMLVARDPAFAKVFAQHPGFEFVSPPPSFPPPPADTRISDLIGDNWGVALLDPGSVQADNGAGLRQGIIGLANRGQPRKPDDWGALRAWAWGAGRAWDYLASLPQVDSRWIGIEGVSRFGKAALVTMAFDQRFAMGLIGSSGEGGAKPHRRNFGEALESLTGSGEYHWMAGNFITYGASAGRSGAKTANDLPLDAHELIALAAPRLLFVSYGVPAQGDAKWLDQQGSYMATIAGGEAWILLGAKDLGRGHDYRTAAIPPPETGLLDGELAWRQHTGGHTDAPNMSWFITWADGKMERPGQ